MPMIAMKSMELSDDDKLDAYAPMPLDKPDYPYGLRICLTDKELATLELDPADAVRGGRFMLQGIACITNVSINDGPDGKCYRVEAQIEDLGILGSDEGDGESIAA
jgi:hypothetical protein